LKQDERADTDERLAMTNLTERLTLRYYTSFLPLVLSQSEAELCLRYCSDSLPLWRSGSGNVVVFLPAPPKIKEDPHARPARLGRVIKRLAECYRLDISGKVALANEVLHTLLEATDKVAVAFSGGRDSLVALHLTIQIKPDVPVVFVNTSIEFPETRAYVHQLAHEWNLNLHEVKPTVNFWKLAEEQGIPVAGRGNTTFMREMSQKTGVKLSNSCCRRMKETPARQFYRAHGIEGVVTGLRVSESLMRKMNFADYGALRYSSTYNTLVAWPLYAWKDEDIAQYIEAHNLPVNPLYGMGYQRVGCWACLQDMFYKDSRLFVLQQQHPHLYEAVRKKFGSQMMRLLQVWAGLEGEYTEEHLDGLYRPCDFAVLEEYRKAKQRRVKQAVQDTDSEGMVSNPTKPGDTNGILDEP